MEIANIGLVDRAGENSITRCYGISQDPQTKNYVMVMEYGGRNLRQYLQQESNQLSFENKIEKLAHISWGLSNIHGQNLVHRDFHSGNVLNADVQETSNSGYITDLGLC